MSEDFSYEIYLGKKCLSLEDPDFLKIGGQIARSSVNFKFFHQKTGGEAPFLYLPLSTHQS